MQKLSPLRARMASFDHAYALAIRLRQESGAHQYIVRTGDPFRPYRVTAQLPEAAVRFHGAGRVTTAPSNPVVASWGMGLDSTAMICGESIRAYDVDGCGRRPATVENH